MYHSIAYNHLSHLLNFHNYSIFQTIHTQVKMYLKIKGGVIEDVKFETFGCASAIASSSMATELIKGQPVSEAMQLTNKAVAEALDGLPDYKLHCSVLAEEAIKSAIEDYESKKK